MPELKPVAAAVSLSLILYLPLWAQSRSNVKSLAAVPASVLQRAAGESTDSTETDADTQPARGFRTTVLHLFQDEKFDQLDAIASAVRSKKERFRGGAWKLNTFYVTLREPGSLTATDAVWNLHQRCRRSMDRRQA
jgi:hypothetical protein